MTTAQQVKTTLGGRPFTLTHAPSAAVVATVSAVLNDRLAQIHRLAPQLDATDVALLAAFNALAAQVEALAAAQPGHGSDA